MKYLSFVLTFILLVSSCSNSSEPNYNSAYEKIISKDIKEAIALANVWKFTKPKISSFITSKELKVVFPDSSEFILELPENEMYIAIAPYINETHTCAVHYLSSCQGEMKNKDFMINISDEGNQIIFSGKVRSLKNGFFELWLPRNGQFDIEISYQNRTASTSVDTYDDSNTCITTVKL